MGKINKKHDFTRLRGEDEPTRIVHCALERKHPWYHSTCRSRHIHEHRIGKRRYQIEMSLRVLQRFKEAVLARPINIRFWNCDWPHDVPVPWLIRSFEHDAWWCYLEPNPPASPSRVIYEQGYTEANLSRSLLRWRWAVRRNRRRRHWRER